LSELELMKKLKPHPHVIKLMGCVTVSGKEKYRLNTSDITRIHPAESLMAVTQRLVIGPTRTLVSDVTVT